MVRKASIQVGDEFGRMKVIGDCGIKSQKPGAKRCHWFMMRCQCGTEKEVVDSALTGGQESCGCARKDVENAGRFKTRHGESTVGKQSLTYLRWATMKRRVKYHPDYKDVTICDRWMNSYEAFKSDLGECPDKLHTLDRIKNDIGYEPGNCRWATRKEQQNNRRVNVIVNLEDGRDMTVAQWCDENQIPANRRYKVYRKISNGFPPEEAIL